VAYHRLGFIHGDLHLGNILFKRTQQPQIVYEIPSANPTATATASASTTPRPITLPTQGYKVVIMDFEKANLQPPAPQAHPQAHPQTHHAKFWKDILFLFKRTEATFDQYDTYYIDWDNRPLLDWTKEAIRRSLAPTHPTLQEVITRFQETRFYARPIQRMTYTPPPAPK
jgi:aminoglycoside phosphotransferase (APT) family kinase protein